jgi:hypothetical protein
MINNYLGLLNQNISELFSLNAMKEPYPNFFPGVYPVLVYPSYTSNFSLPLQAELASYSSLNTYNFAPNTLAHEIPHQTDAPSR